MRKLLFLLTIALAVGTATTACDPQTEIQNLLDGWATTQNIDAAMKIIVAVNKAADLAKALGVADKWIAPVQSLCSWLADHIAELTPDQVEQVRTAAQKFGGLDMPTMRSDSGLDALNRALENLQTADD